MNRFVNGAPVNKSCLFIGFILVGIVFIASLVPPGQAQTGSMTMEDVPGKRGPGSIIMEDNKIYQNNLVGIRIRGDLSVTIKTCQIYSNGEAGIPFYTQARAALPDSRGMQNGSTGMTTLESDPMTSETNTT